MNRLKALKEALAAIGTKKQVAKAHKAYRAYERNRFNGCHMGLETAALLGAMCGVLAYFYFSTHLWNPLGFDTDGRSYGVAADGTRYDPPDHSSW